MTLVKRMIMPPPIAEDDAESWQLDPNEADMVMTCGWGTDPQYARAVALKMLEAHADDEVRLDEERSDELTTLALGTKATRGRTSAQDAPPL
jgi:hypothetical protein